VKPDAPSNLIEISQGPAKNWMTNSLKNQMSNSRLRPTPKHEVWQGLEKLKASDEF
jgi:hypothetical protein